MRPLKEILFPRTEANKIELTTKHKKEMEYLDDEIGMCGSDWVAYEYELKTGRSLMLDIFISSISWGFIISGIIILIYIIL